jgi:hypothetical protein
MILGKLPKLKVFFSVVTYEWWRWFPFQMAVDRLL